MATTSPDNLRTPNPTDPYNLVADLAILASDTQAALVKRGNLYIGTSAQRIAFTSAPDGTHWQDTNGDMREYVRRGGSWAVSNPRAGGTVTGVSVTPGVNSTYTVSFPAGVFSTAPSVMLTGNSPATRIRDSAIFTTEVSTSGFTLNVYGTGSGTWTGWSVDWLAVGI